MKAIFDLIGAINSFVWGPPMMVLLIGTGIWLTLGTRFVQVREFPRPSVSGWHGGSSPTRQASALRA
jgi:AGCS family alanine or glycine:cation symporter